MRCSTRSEDELNTASRTIEDTGVRSRALEQKLRSVEQLPEAEASKVLALQDEAVQIFEGESEDADLYVATR